MGKNGGQPHDTVLTLEEALRRFARKRSEGGADSRDETIADSNSNVRYASFSPKIKSAGESVAVCETRAADANALAQRDDANAGEPAGEEIVAVIAGVPRTLAELERIAAADRAYPEDFQANAIEPVDYAEFREVDEAALARHALIRDYAFTAMGTALMVLVAVMVMRVPIVSHRPTLVAQSIATPALKASSEMSTDDLITTLVIIPDTDVQMASVHKINSDMLEAQIKDTLKSRAFTDIGVSVSKHGDAYLAGEVYSLDEAHKIARIVHRVNGVQRVHFLHPDVRQAQGPAYFGVTTAWSPEVWGAKVEAVVIGSPADKAGIKVGDVISEFDGKTIPDAKSFKNLFAQYSPGQRVEFRVWHKGQPEYLVARLGEQSTLARL